MNTISHVGDRIRELKAEGKTYVEAEALVSAEISASVVATEPRKTRLQNFLSQHGKTIHTFA